MKFNKLIPKFAVTCFFSAFLFNVNPAQAQFYTSPIADQEADPGPGSSNNVLNTGTDATVYNGEVFQVMAWDGDDPRFSWDYANGTRKGSLNLQDPLGPDCDPDVVVAEDPATGELYAMVVYINSDKRIRWERYTWNAGNQEFEYLGTTDDFGILGTINNITNIPNKCSYPNIDANSVGNVGIVWQEGFSELINVTVSSPSLGSFQYTTNASWSLVYAAFGEIDGSAFNSPLSIKIKGPSNNLGDLVSKQLKVGEQNRQPDIALSERADSRVFITYIKHSADASINPSDFKDYLVVQKEYINSISGTNVFVWDQSQFLKNPRIAASPEMNNYNSFEDYELVVLKNPNGCGVKPLWEIWNYGVSNGLYHDGILVNETLTQETNEAPVVAYFGGKGAVDQATGVYTVSWAADVASQGVGDQLDVLARHFQGGPVTSGFSFVNKEISGNQFIPSIAGRHLDFLQAYAFFNEHDSYIGYKLSSKKAGAEDLRVRSGSSGSSSVFPNPFSKVVNFNYTIEKGETPSEILIYNATGVVVDKVQVKNTKPGNYTETIRMKENAPDGMYILKLNTSLKSQTLRATKIN